MGRVGYVKNISPQKGEKLLEFVNMLLPIDSDFETNYSKNDQTKKCDGKNCRALKN